ncbi:myeloid cell surface antigen CD33-like [Pristis pectinata]|uniref:myeloid cell surface antigen CD33-like n=1 Tax=Pristis pectinata TaxID=685728 RepID=UPI00223DD489|nr:myeloid cell surface antigen CD33-like [Pristis pectinata]
MNRGLECGSTSSKFWHRAQLTGDLNDGDCSLVINNVKQNDQGPYYFRVEFKSNRNYEYPVIQLYVSDFMDKPSIFPAEVVAGKPVNIMCTFSTMCDETAPTLTWVTPTDVPPSVIGNVTQRGDTRTYTSVLTLTPELKHHGETLTCKVRYPSVSSERTITLTVQRGCDRIEKCVIAGITIGALVIVGMVITITIIFWAKCCHSKRENALAQPKVQKAEGEVVDVESLYQELRASDQKLYSDIKPSYN